MNKNILIILLLLVFILTVTICVLKPKTHKPIVFENKDFEISMITKEIKNDIPNVTVEIESPNIDIPSPDFSKTVQVPDFSLNQKNVKTNNNQVAKNQKVAQNSNAQMPKNTNSVSKTQSKSATDNKNANAPASVAKHVKNNPQPKQVDSRVANETKSNNSSPSSENIVKSQNDLNSQKVDNNQVKPASTPVQKPVKVLTEQEEIIAWNKWRSDLQNKLMKDSKISAPIGTSFLFSFTVDKYGNITNLKTWSNNPSYTPLAVKVIKPLLLSYQHTYILNFPEGSQRMITNANGGFTMARTSRYSSPSDYNDYERVTR